MKLIPVYYLVFGLFLLSCEQKVKETNRVETSSMVSVQDSLLILTEQIEKDSTDYTLFRKRAELFIKSGRLDPAIRDITAALELNQEDPAVYVLLGDVYFILGQTDNSLNSYKKAFEIDRNKIQPLLSLAEAYLVLQDYEQSLRYLDLAASVDVNNPKTYYLKGILKMETGDTLEALTNLKIAGNIDSNYFEALMQTGSILSSLQDTTAVVYYRKALKVNPGDERALFLTALSLQENGDFDEALDLYSEVNTLNPQNKNAHFNTGYIYMVELEDYDAAILAFQKAITIDPAFVRAVYNLGRSYEAKGMYDEARVQYKQALGLETNYPLAVDGLNRLDKIQFGE